MLQKKKTFCCCDKKMAEIPLNQPGDWSLFFLLQNLYINTKGIFTEKL